METKALTIFEPKNVGTIAQIAPQAYNENQLSHDRCIEVGNQLFTRAEAEGMSDSLDQEIALYIERAKKTVRKMNTKRSAVTQMFDMIRSAYTTLENEIDVNKKDTIVSKLQQLRNAYADMKRRQLEEQRMEQMRRQRAEAARAKYAADVEAELVKHRSGIISEAINKLYELFSSLTADNRAEVENTIKSVPEELPQRWLDTLYLQVQLPQELTQEEARDIQEDIKSRLEQEIREEYQINVCSTRDDILDRLPSKHEELMRMAKADAEEAARIKAQIEEQERKEAERREAERREREEKEKAAAELAKEQREMDGLFGAASAAASVYQPKATVRKRIRLLSAEGMMQVLIMWWLQQGSTMSVEELEKEFKKQLTFCNRLANDKEHPVLISSEYVEYVDDVKAK
ncbi:MAG: hypothetical protein ACI3X6_05240 [Alloprevotella sp.]